MHYIIEIVTVVFTSFSFLGLLVFIL